MNKETQITKTQLRIILGKDWKYFEEKILSNCLCGKCHCIVRMVDYKIFLNDLCDIIFKGTCVICGARVNRYVEVGENEIFVKKVKKELKNK